jgi:hypothetical protein
MICKSVSELIVSRVRVQELDTNFRTDKQLLERSVRLRMTKSKWTVPTSTGQGPGRSHAHSESWQHVLNLGNDLGPVKATSLERSSERA